MRPESSKVMCWSGKIHAATMANPASGNREIDEEVYIVVYTPRKAVRRIISARPASRRERDVYREAFASRDS